MKLNRYLNLLFIAEVALVLLGTVCTLYPKGLVQDDPVLASEAATAPLIDGKGDDACWQNATWQSIDQVWIPYGKEVPASDYSGRYKVVWSAANNLLYFLVEVTDDVFVDGYIPGLTSDVYNFDIIEVFIDEDKSGGLHVFDGTGSVGLQYGTNAENAFSYHIYGDFPEADNVTKNCYVGDLAGTSWSDAKSPNYASHFPEFALRKSNGTAVWEFSLIVYKDTYQESNKEAARSQLTTEKVMGLSLAYCDNDDPSEIIKSRDNFYGSVWVPAAAYNDHWMNADDYGTIKLVSGDQSGVPHDRTIKVNSLDLFPNPASSSLQVQVSNLYRGEVAIRIFNLLGQEVLRTMASKTDWLFTQKLALPHLPSGTYFLRAQMDREVLSRKILVTSTR